MSAMTPPVDAQLDPLDPRQMEHWIVERLPRRWRRHARLIDSRVVGGIAVASALIVVVGVATAVGWLLSTIDGSTGFARFDNSFAEWGATHAGQWRPWLGRVTELGGTIPLALIMGGVAVIDHERTGQWRAAPYLATVGVGVVAVNNALKAIVDRPRPDIAQLVGWSGASFPSGHTAAAAACWLAIALVVTRRAPSMTRRLALCAALAVAGVVGASRILLGVHWFTDVLGGLAVGWAWFLLASIIFGGRLLHFGDPVEELAELDQHGADSATAERLT